MYNKYIQKYAIVTQSLYNLLKAEKKDISIYSIDSQICRATAVHFPGRNWPAGWLNIFAVTRRRPIGRLKFHNFDIRRNFTRCTYVHLTDLIFGCMYTDLIFRVHTDQLSAKGGV